MSQKPSVGRIVHYVSHGTPLRPDGTQAYRKECRAAIVTQVHPRCVEHGDTEDCVGLAVLNPTGMFFQEHIRSDETRTRDDGTLRTVDAYAGGTWHWPERVE